MAEKCSRENRPARPSDTAHSWTNATSSKRPVGGSNPSRDARQKSRVTVPDSNPYQKVRIFVSQKEPKMTNRHPAFHHANDTETSRDGREDMDTRSPETEAGSMQIVAQSYFQPEHAVLPLQGFFRLYEAQLRSERKSARTIKIYNGALGKFGIGPSKQSPQAGSFRLCNYASQAFSCRCYGQTQMGWAPNPRGNHKGKAGKRNSSSILSRFKDFRGLVGT